MTIRRPAVQFRIGALLFTVAFGFVNHCALLQKIPLKPGFELEKVEFVGFSLTAARLRLYSQVSNPYPVDLPQAQLTAGLTVEGVKLADVKGEPKTIPARSVAPVVFDVSIPYSSLSGIYQKFPGKEQLLAEISGQLVIPVPEAARVTPGVPRQLSFDFQSKRSIPAILPSLSIRNFRIIKPSADELRKKVIGSVTENPEQTVKKAASFLDSLLNKGGTSPGSAVQAGLEELDIEIRTEFEIVLENKAAARLDFKRLSYEFFLNGERFLNGNAKDIKNDGRVSVIRVETKFPLKSVSSGLSSALKSRSVSFRLVGSAAVTIPAVGTGEMAYDFDRSGAHSW